MKLTRFWEMFTQNAEELFADICWSVKTKWWIKPYNLSFSILVLFVTVNVFCCFWNVILCLNPLLANALLYKSLDLLKVVSSADKVLILLDILPGRFLIIFGGQLERMLIYNRLLSGLLWGWYLPVVRFRV